ncbi:MAG: TolC family protein [candidate division Zixibacteria bacterium]|nr:TolC family protein [candidate division Zixibacteria bacterium]
MKKIALILTLLLALGSVQVFAKTYSLDECIEMAKQTDPDLERFRNNVKTSGMTVWNQAGQFLPSLSFGGDYTKTKMYGILDSLGNVFPGYTTNSYSTGFTLNYTLFDGLQNVWNYFGSKQSKSVADYNLVSSVSNLQYAVKGSYYLVLKAKRDFEVAEQAVGRSEELLKLFEEKYKLGSSSLSEVLKQKVQYGNDKLTLVRAANNYKLAKYQLAITIGLDPQQDLEIVDLKMKKQTVSSLQSLISEATASHPSLMSAYAEMNASKYDVRSAKGTYLPSLTLRHDQSWSGGTFSDLTKFESYNRRGMTIVSLNFNIFDRFTRERNMSRAKASLNNSKASSFYTKNRVIKDVQDAYLGVKLAEETLVVTEETERSASEDMALVQAKYNLGAAALWELLDAQVSLKSAQFNKVKAEFDYNLAHAKLLNAMGK